MEEKIVTESEMDSLLEKSKDPMHPFLYSFSYSKGVFRAKRFNKDAIYDDDFDHLTFDIPYDGPMSKAISKIDRFRDSIESYV